MNAPRAPSKASAAMRSDSSSPSTRKSGSMPALSAWARSTRAQNPWMVEIQAPSAARASARRPSSTKRRRTRVRISAAALSVNVIARIDSTGRPSSVTARTKRSTSTVVLPVPAPARTISEPSRRATARSCCSVRPLIPRTCRSTGTNSRHSRRRRRGCSRARRCACGRRRRAPARAPTRAWPGTRSGGRRSLSLKSEPSSATSSATIPRGVSDRPSGTYTPPAARTPSRRSTTSM